MTDPQDILTTRQMRAVEASAIGRGTTSGAELMERAGAGVVGAILARWPDLAQTPHEALILCGPGNNGGDGFVIARLLALRGWALRVVLYGEPARLPPDAAAAYRLCLETVPVTDFAAWRVTDPIAPGTGRAWPDLIVDAVFGGGLSRPLPEDLCQRLWDLDSHCPEGMACRVAVDAPSGLDLDTGRVRLADPQDCGLPSHYDLTVGFHRWRPGHFLGHGPKWCGSLALVDLGLDDPHPEGPELRLTAPNLWRHDKGHRALPERGGHKYDYGHALVLSGPAGACGAARLAARAALRAGAGLVTLGCPKAALAENAARLDAVMLRVVEGADDLSALLRDPRITALCLGPGMGLERARELVPVALASGRRCVLDADALSAFAEAPQDLFALLHPDAILTPHGGEFARLFPDLAAAMHRPDGPSALEAARAAAARAGAALLLKGPCSVIAAPSGEAWLNAAVYADAAPWLATAGAGDVLAGIIAGHAALPLAGPGLAALAADAAWLHAAAARRFGPGLIAEDLPEQIPAVWRDLCRQETPRAGSAPLL